MISAPLHLCFPTVICPSQVAGEAGSLGSSVASSLASQATGSVLNDVGAGLVQAADWLVGRVIDLIDSSTTPGMSEGWFSTELGLMVHVALLIVMPILMAATIGAVLRQDARRLGRVWGIGLPVALFAGVAGSQLAGWGLAITDSLCSVFLGNVTEKMAGELLVGATAGGPSAPPVFLAMIVDVLMIVGGLLIWLELIVRSAGVYVATFFMPLALIGYIWPATAGMARRAVEILVSLILSKFVIVASVSLGLSALSGGGADAPLSGLAVLMMAAFAPFALLRLAPVVEASAIAHLEGMGRRPGRAAFRTATAAARAPTHPITQLVMSRISAARGDSVGTDGGGLTTTSVASQPRSERRADYPMPSSDGGSAGSGGKNA